MSAPTQTRLHPARSGRPDIRLPWWALALPALAFVTLLLLILNPSDAQAATTEPAITQLIEHIRQLIMR